MDNNKTLGGLAVVAVTVLLLACTGTDSAPGQDPYPSKPIEMVAWAAPGGGSDRMCRTFARAAEGILPQRTYVVNKSGGGGSVGMAYVQSRPADGHTLLGVTNNLVFIPLTRPELKYSSKDFTPLIMWGFDAKVVAVSAASPYRTIEDLVNTARQRPGRLKIATFGLGSDDHITGYMLGQEAQATFGFVPFDGGGEQLAALLGGHTDAHISEVSEVKAQLDAGKVRVLAVATEERLANMPEVPTLKEKGWNVVLPKFRGVVAKKGTPDEVVEYLITTFQKVVQTPLFQTYLTNSMIEPLVLVGEDFETLIQQQEEQFRPILKELGF
jgi:tripartite-type tricarboxylate transporter receptor subunit TctC